MVETAQVLPGVEGGEKADDGEAAKVGAGAWWPTYTCPGVQSPVHTPDSAALGVGGGLWVLPAGINSQVLPAGIKSQSQVLLAGINPVRVSLSADILNVTLVTQAWFHEEIIWTKLKSRQIVINFKVYSFQWKTLCKTLKTILDNFNQGKKMSASESV